jgi:hypothetical protein
MKSLKSLCSLLTGMLLICLGSVAFVGCSDVSSLNGIVPSQLTGAIAPPKAAPAGTTMLITPTDAAGTAVGAPVATAVTAISDGLKLESPSMSFSATSTVVGQQPAIVVEILNALGQQIGVSQPIPLAQVGTGLATGAINLPTNVAGSYRIALAPGTVLQLANVAAMTRGVVPEGLTLLVIDVAFDLELVGGVVKSSTIPVDFTLNLTRDGSKFKLAQSTMSLVWNAALGSKAPTDGKADLRLNLFNNGAAAGVATQSVTISNGTGLFRGTQAAPFDSTDIILDVRNSK